MPEAHQPHPWTLRSAPGATSTRSPVLAGPAYAELAVTSNFTFLTGASHPEEMVGEAALQGHAYAAIADRHTLAGVVRAHVAAKEAGIGLAVGTRAELAGLTPDAPGLSMLLFASDRPSYARLCRLLTTGKRRAEKGQCSLALHDYLEHQEGLLTVVLPPGVRGLTDDYLELLQGLARRLRPDDRLSVAVCRHYGDNDAARLEQVADLCRHVGAPMAAVNDALYHEPSRKPLQDVLACIRLGCTLDALGLDREPTAERYLKSPSEMARLFAGYPQALSRSVQVARRSAEGFSLDQLRYEYPDEVVPKGRTAMEHLTDLAWQGAAERFPGGVPGKVQAQIRHELGLIDELAYAPYFLTVHDLVQYARSRGILCQGRGAAANSAVCYCLGVTAVDPARIDLLFERFVSKERNEPPDIDIDFEHERREEVIQYIYAKYGRERAALTAEVITYRGRSAIRDVGKALGLSLDCVDRLAKQLDWWEKGFTLDTDETPPAAGEGAGAPLPSDKPRPQPLTGDTVAGRLRELGMNPEDPTLLLALRLAGELLGFPRHLSQHVGGFVITRGLLCESVPIENARMPDRTIIEWDKNDIEAVGMLKVDCLGLGMLTAIRKALDLVNASRPGEPPLALHSIPAEDPAVYDMLCRADSVGVFQVESRAQMSMLPRLRPRTFYDLVIEVSIVRPGPIVGDMVHPYLRRRDGLEEPVYPTEAVRAVLGKTLGVPLFQEQAMKLAMVAAGFTAGEADGLRRAIAAWKTKQKVIYAFGQRIIDGMLANGYSREFAQGCFEQLKGFSSYGFPESHAASFALLVYASSWLKRYHPAEFAAALINSHPMGFYKPAQLVRDAQEHGVEVRPIDIHHSGWDCRIEQGPAGPALRLGMRLVKGLAETEARLVEAKIAERGTDRPFSSVEALWRAAGVRVATLRRLAGADALGSMGLDRQRALWEVRSLRDEELPLFEFVPEIAADGVPDERPRPAPVRLPRVPESRKVNQDYRTTGLSLKAHPVAFMRDRLRDRGAVSNGRLTDEPAFPHGKLVAVAGIVLVRQRPATASGVVFMTLEDETGVANLIVRPDVFKRYRSAARHSVVILARGRVQRAGPVVHVLVSRIEDGSEDQADLAPMSRDFH